MQALINREQWDNNQLHPQDFPGSLMKRLEIQHSVQLWFLGHSSPITLLSQPITCTLGSPPNTAKELPELERAQTHIPAARMPKSQSCQYPGRQVLITTFCLTTASHRCFPISNSASKSDSLWANYVMKTEKTTKQNKHPTNICILEILVPAMECWSHWETDILLDISPSSAAYSGLKRHPQIETGFRNPQLQYDYQWTQPVLAAAPWDSGGAGLERTSENGCDRNLPGFRSPPCGSWKRVLPASLHRMPKELFSNEHA